MCEISSLLVLFFCRTKLEKAKKEQEDRLEYVKEQLEICSHDSKRQIKEITAKVEAQVKNVATDHFTPRSVISRAYSIIDGKKMTLRTVRLDVFNTFTSQESSRENDWNLTSSPVLASISFELKVEIIASSFLCILVDIASCG